MNLFSKRILCTLGTLFLFFVTLLPRLPFFFAPAAGILALFLLLAHMILHLCGRGVLLPRNCLIFVCILLLSALVCFFRITLPSALFSATCEEEAEWSGRVVETLDAEEGIYCISSPACNGRRLPFAKAVLKLPDHKLCAGDEVSFLASGRPFYPTEKNRYLSEGCHGVLVGEALLSRAANPASPSALIEGITDRIEKRLCKIAGEAGGAFYTALLLGDDNALSSRLSLNFRRLGITHMLAVSGMHLVMIAGALSFLFRGLRIKRTVSDLLTVLFLGFYTLMTGCAPSVLRAFVMAVTLRLAFPLRRRSDALTSLLLSGVALFLFFPSLSYSISFWLSFLATFGLIVGGELLSRASFLERIPSSVRTLLITPAAMTITATICTLPVTVLTFGEFSLLCLPANLLYALPFQFLLYFTILILPFGPNPLTCAAAAKLYEWLLKTTDALAGIPHAVISVSHPAILITVLVGCAAILVFLLLPKPHVRLMRTLFPALILLVCIFVGFFSFPIRDEQNVTVLATEEEGSLLLLGAKKSRILIDCSSSGHLAASEVLDTLDGMRVYDLAYYYVTHYRDTLRETIDAISRNCYLHHILLPEPCDPFERAEAEKLIAYIKEEGIDYTLLPRGEVFSCLSYRLLLSAREQTRTDFPRYVLMIETEKECLAYISGSAVLPMFTGEDRIPSGITTIVFGSCRTVSPAHPYIDFPPSTRRILFASPGLGTALELPEDIEIFYYTSRTTFPLN